MLNYIKIIIRIVVRNDMQIRLLYNDIFIIILYDCEKNKDINQ